MLRVRESKVQIPAAARMIIFSKKACIISVPYPAPYKKGNRFSLRPKRPVVEDDLHLHILPSLKINGYIK